MKNLIIIAAFTIASSTALAGRMKDLQIDAEEMIVFEMYKRAHLKIESISNYSLVGTSEGVSVLADVKTIHPENGSTKTWTCTIPFQKFGTRFVAYDIDCR